MDFETIKRSLLHSLITTRFSLPGMNGMSVDMGWERGDAMHGYDMFVRWTLEDFRGGCCGYETFNTVTALPCLVLPLHTWMNGGALVDRRTCSYLYIKIGVHS
jgi:hypothetical protein